MKDIESSSGNLSKYENELKLYTLLVDQFFKYQTIIWQIPTALVFGNFIAIENFLKKPLPLFALAVFNFGLIFVLDRMITSQRRIIEATRKAEKTLRAIFGDFLPTFKEHKWPATDIIVRILFILEVGLVAYTVFLFLKSPWR